MSDFSFTFITTGRKAQCAPNPEFPEGISVDAGYKQMCAVDMPYPADSCGVMRVDCAKCGVKVGFTVAGRVDDPRRVALPCKVAGNVQIRQPSRSPWKGN